MTLLMTGFPGFLASALLPRLLARRPRVHAVCLVQPRHRVTAQRRVREIESAHPHTSGRIRVVEGDITEPGLGLASADRRAIARTNEVWHLAAVYDLAAGEAAAQRVNVDGTAAVLDLCSTLPDLRRLQYVSTCYVSGAYDGEFQEEDLEEGQPFRNHYEATKFAAEVLVRKAMADGLPVTVYRPGIVVGDSTTGETQKYDGPYFLAAFLRRQVLPIAVVTAVGDPDRVHMCVVPRDFVVAAMDELSVLEGSVGRTYALTDPHPPTVREVVDRFAGHLHKRVVWLPLPLGLTRTLVGSVPGAEWLLGFPAESVDYFASPTRYSTTNVRSDLAFSGLTCPPFESYAGRLLDYMTSHPEVDAQAMT